MAYSQFDTNQNYLNTNSNYSYAKNEEQAVGFLTQLDDIPQPFQIKAHENLGFPDNEKIKLLDIKRDIIIIVTDSNKLFRWRQNKDNKCKEYQIPETQGKIGNFKDKIKQKLHFNVQEKGGISNIFTDQDGIFCLLTSSDGQAYLFHQKSNQLKHIPQLNNYIIKSGCWDDRNQDEQIFKQILLGTSEGQIIQVSFQLKFNNVQGNDDIEQVVIKEHIQLPNSSQTQKQNSINNIKLLEFYQENKDVYQLVLVTTHSSIFYFLAKDRQPSTVSYEELFLKYSTEESIKDAAIPFIKSHTSYIDICYNKIERPHSFLFTNGNGLVNIQFPDEKQTFDMVKLKTMEYYNYQKKQTSEISMQFKMDDFPNAIGLTQYHYYILHKDSLTILSRITQKIVHYQDLKQMGKIQGMQKDQYNECFWIYSQKEVRKIELEYEDQDVWRVYLQEKQYKNAFEACLTAQDQQVYSTYIAKLYTDDLLEKGQYKQAAKVFLESKISFEEALSKLILASINSIECQIQVDYFLGQIQTRLSKQLNKESQIQILLSLRLSYKAQWVNNAQYNYEKSLKSNDKQLQIKLHKILDQYTNNLQNFLKKYNEIINEEVTFQILQSHGLIKILLYFCELRQKLEMIITHNINEEQYSQSLEYVQRLETDQMKQIIYKYAHFYFKFCPQEVCVILIKKIKKFDATKFLTSLFDIPQDQWDIGIKLLQHCIIKLKSTQKTIHNTYIFFLAENKLKSELKSYFDNQQKEFNKNFNYNFNLVFAFKTCQNNDMYQSLIQLYGMMELWSDAVNMALEYDLLEEAKNYAKQVNDDILSKKLWMQIVQYMLKNQDRYDVQEIVNLTEDNTDQDTFEANDKPTYIKSKLKIDEIIPHLDQNMKINQFQGKISNSLQQYNQEIKELKDLMELYSKQADNCQKEIIYMKESYFQVEINKICDHCLNPIFDGKEYFYIFPCSHAYHQNCLFTILRQNSKLRPHYIDIINDIIQLNQKLGQIQNRQSIKNTNDNGGSESFFDKYFSQNNNSDTKSSFRESINNSSLFRSGNKNSSALKQKNSSLEFDDEVQEMQIQINEIKKIKDRHDQIIAQECIKCGFIQIDMCYEEINTQNKSTWDL